MADNTIEILEVKDVPYNYEYVINYKGTVVNYSVSKRKVSDMTLEQLASHLLPNIRGLAIAQRLSNVLKKK